MNNQIITILKNNNIEGQIIEEIKSPSILKYKIYIKNNVSINKILKLDKQINFETGEQVVINTTENKKTIEVEIERTQKEILLFNDILKDTPKEENKINVIFGKDTDNKNIIVNLLEMPHLLTAGQTGSGKSVFINSIINSLILTYTPQEIGLFLIDCKRVEFSIYENMPHLQKNVIKTPKEASQLLDFLIDEMMERYKLLEQNNCKNLIEFNKQSKNKLPFLFCFIDELADLMQTNKKEIQDKIIKLLQLSRASGICLIMATQRPSNDIINGLIKANCPCRLSFSLPSMFDSKTILNRKGAEQLQGHGDGLLLKNGSIDLLRFQAPFITTEEIQNNLKMLKDKYKRTEQTKEEQKTYILTNQDKKIIEMLRSGEDLDKIKFLYRLNNEKITYYRGLIYDKQFTIN